MMHVHGGLRPCLLVALMALFATPAAAEDIKVYTGIGLGGFSVDYGNDATGAAIKGSSSFGGYLSVAADINPYLSFEMRYGRSGSSTLKRNGGSWVSHSVNVDGLSSVFLRPQFPFKRHGHIYAILGTTSAKLKYTNAGTETITTKSAFSFGGGFKVHVQDTFSLGLEYTRYTSKRSFTLNQGQISGYALQLHYLLD